MKAAALALLLTVLPSAAQNVEEVTVYGGNFAGFWRVSGPGYLQVTLTGGVHWGPLREAICRISHDSDGYATHCFSQGAGRGGTLAKDGAHFHLAWGSMLARLVFDGEVTSADTFEGHFAAKLMGIPITNPDQSKGTRLAAGGDVPDAAGKAAVLRAILAGDTVAHDPRLDANIAAARDASLGAVASITYLGRQFRPGADGPKAPPPDLTYLATYAVEYAQDERICWLHQDDDGKLSAFQCG
jgi:hypothetical protein